MRETRKSMTNKEFHNRLDELRSKIDSLPEQYHETLRAAADNVEQQHKRLAADVCPDGRHGGRSGADRGAQPQEALTTADLGWLVSFG